MFFFSGDMAAHVVRIANLEEAKGPTEIENIGGNVHCSYATLETSLYVIVCVPGITPRDCSTQYLIYQFKI